MGVSVYWYEHISPDPGIGEVTFFVLQVAVVSNRVILARHKMPALVLVSL